MRTRLLLLLLLSPVALHAVESAIPVPFPAGRYEKLEESSPFALATPQVPVAPVENTAGFAEGWYVSGLARADGKDFVTIKSRDQSIQFSLFGSEENRERAVVLDHVDWSKDIGKSKVTIRKGDEIANLEFNQAEMQPATGPTPQTAPPQTLRAAGQPIIPRPAGMPAPTGIRPPMVNQSIVRPRTAPVAPAIPLPGTKPTTLQQSPAVGGAGAAANAANAANARRRIRVINSGQPNP